MATTTPLIAAIPAPAPTVDIPAPRGPDMDMVIELAETDDAAYDAWVDSQADPTLTDDHLYAD